MSNSNVTKLIQEMKSRVYQSNLTLPKYNLVKLTWGNVSEIDREHQLIVIKPSGVPYAKMKVNDMVVTDLEGNCLPNQSLRPSSDLATHVKLYQMFSGIGSVVHTHSKYAVMWAQAGRSVPAYGTTHADYFYGKIPCTRELTQREIETDYEGNTGKVIGETFQQLDLDPIAMPAVLVQGHGPFTWGTTPDKAVENSLVLDEICEIALETERINGHMRDLPHFLLDKHYFRKHGENAYYGQK